MNKNKQTDRIIRRKLYHHASPTPTHLWEKIEVALPPEKDNNRFAWGWKSSTLLIFILALGLFAFAWWKPLEPAYADAAPQSEQAASPLAQLNIAHTAKDLPTAKLQNDSSTSLSATDENIENLPSNFPKRQKASTKATHATNAADVFTTKSKTLTSKTALYIASKNSEATISPTQLSTTKEETKVSPFSKTFEKSDNHTFCTSLLNLHSLSTTAFASIEANNADLPAFLQEPEAPKCATFGKWLKLYLYADMYASPDRAFKQLIAKTNDFKDYAANRKATESQKLSYNVGTRLSVVSTRGLALRTGFVYSQINERFNYKESEEREIITIIRDEEGNIISRDTSIETITRFFNHYNKYKMLDLPVLVGYEVNFKKFSLSVNSGIYANLLFKQEGSFLSPDSEPVDFSSDAENSYRAFRERVDLSFYGSIAAYINLNPHWQLMLEPHIRYYLDPITTPDYVLEQRYTTIGLMTGLRYRF